MKQTKNTNYIVIIITAPPNTGKNIAVELLSARLAACVSILPVESIYWWENKLTEDKEDLLLVKTKRELFEKVKERVLKVHPYEVPEINALPIVDGFDRYFRWLDENTL